MDNSFTAIDFETAQGYRWSICQVGLVRVENGKIVKELDLLVQPPNNYYWSKMVQIHGINPIDTAKSPFFDEIWHTIEPYIKYQTVVAHNGMAFDFPVLKSTLEYYDLQEPDYDRKCTYKIYRSNLASLCQKFSIALNHHDALSDARACARLYQLHLNNAI
jgi:DNA polymerase-3 subunit epsilon